MPGSAGVPYCSAQCAQAPSPSFYWKEVPGQVVFGVCALCIVLLLLQHAALRRRDKDVPS